MRSKGDEDKDDGDEEASGNPSCHNVVPIRGIKFHPTEEIELLRKRNITGLSFVRFNITQLVKWWDKHHQQLLQLPDDHDLDEKEEDAENSGEAPSQLYDLTHF